MADKAVLFTIEVDTASGEAKIKRFVDAVNAGNKRIEEGGKHALTVFDRMKRGLEGVGGALESAFSFKSVLGGLGIAALVGTVKSLGSSFIDAVKEGQKISNVATAFESLTARAGVSAARLKQDLAVATKGMVDDTELMRMVNRAILMDVPVREKEFAEFVGNVRKMARAMGEDATEASERAIEAIGRLATRQLKALGLAVDQEKAYRDLAKERAVAVEMLTEEEKRLALYNAVAKKAKEETQGLALAHGTLAGDIKKAETSWKDYWDEIKEALSQKGTVEAFRTIIAGGKEGLLEHRRKEWETFGEAQRRVILQNKQIGSDYLELLQQDSAFKIKIPKPAEPVDFLSQIGAGDARKRMADVQQLSSAVKQAREELAKASDPQLRSAWGQVVREVSLRLIDVKVQAGQLTEEAAKLQRAEWGVGAEEMRKSLAGLAAVFPKVLDPVQELGIEFDSLLIGKSETIVMSVEKIRAGVEDGTYTWSEYFRAVDAANKALGELADKAPQIKDKLASFRQPSSFDDEAIPEWLRGDLTQFRPDGGVPSWGRGAGEGMPVFDREAEAMASYAETVKEAALSMADYETQWVASVFAMAASSAQFGEAMGNVYGVLSAFGSSVGALLGQESRLAQGLRKIQAGMLLVAGIVSIKDGWVRVAKSGGADATGWLMIAKGIEAVAVAKQLGASGSGAGAGGGGGSGRGGASTGVGGYEASVYSREREYRANSYAGRYGENPYLEVGLQSMRPAQMGPPVTIYAMDSKSLRDTLVENAQNRHVIGEAAYRSLTGR